MTARSGATVVEVLVALVTGLIVVQLSLELLERCRAAQRSLEARAEAIATLRIGRHLVRSELRAGVAGRDWTLPSSDSLALRAFRGVGAVCPERPSIDELLVAYSGIRAPDPDKDSVLLLLPDGSWRAERLAATEATGLRCPASNETPVRLWRLDAPPPPGAVLARIFERGAYHVSDGALRYRRGGGGRQPLTPEILDPGLSGFRVGPSGVALELVPAGGRAPPWYGFLARPDDAPAP